MSEACREVKNCRVCGNGLEPVLDLGTQCLAGQFPAQGEPDPPSFPLVLARCAAGCGLVQLAHTVDPELMFRDYWYRSGVSLTMRKHLQDLGDEAVGLLSRTPRTVLDIGANDHLLLNHLADYHNVATHACVGVDPCNLTQKGTITHIRDFYPTPVLAGDKFDLIFTVACFYDADNPVAFAQAVRENLAPDGLWCVEVGYSWDMLWKTAYDSICHEHLCYYDFKTLYQVLKRAHLRVVKMDRNGCNGGSLRVYACREESKAYEKAVYVEIDDPAAFATFAAAVGNHRAALLEYLLVLYARAKTVHLLGASTKFNTVLQYCMVKTPWVSVASDRDPRKVGRRTPGTNVQIVSEEVSRQTRPDVYLTVLGHFREELLGREKDYLARGGKITFVLPKVEEVGR